ncbi:MAG: acyltransferase family protein [Pseudomonadota bacterium]
MSMAAHQYRADIDGLRMVAVVPVVLYHAGLPGVSGGYIGVDIFFVISGYLIANIIHREIGEGRFTLVGFYERRARRILPALMAVIAASFLVGWFVLLPSQFVSFAKSALATLGFVSNIWFWHDVNDYFGYNSDFSPLLHTWSLAVEEQFYIFFPLLLILLAGASHRWRVGIIVLMVLASFVISVVAVQRYPSAAFFLLPSRIWELGLGVLLALGFAPKAAPRWIREPLALLALIAILGPVVAYTGETRFPGLAALPPCLGAAALIWIGGNGGSQVGRFLSWRPFVFVGLISYSLYLWHWPILAFMRLRLLSTEIPIEIGLAAVALSFVLAILSWRFIEKPFRVRGAAGLSRGAIFKSSGAATLIVMLASLGVWGWAGLPGRYSPDLIRVVSTDDVSLVRGLTCEGSAATLETCLLGGDKAASSEPQFLVWGDSHAAAIAPGLNAMANDLRMPGLLANRNSCPPVLGLARLDNSLTNRTRCQEARRQVWQILEQEDAIKTVILASRWAYNFEGQLAPGEFGVPAILSENINGSKAAGDVSENFELMSRYLPETIDLILASGREVIILGSVPEIGWDVPDYLGQNLQWGDALPETPDRAAVMQRQRRSETFLMQIADAREGVTYVSLIERMCAGECQTHSASQTYYIDDDHLSAAGAIRFVTPAIQEVMAANSESVGN